MLRMGNSSTTSKPSKASYNRAGYRVIRKILEKYEKNSFSKLQIAYDPKDELEEIRNDNPKWQIPTGVYDKISGTVVHAED